MQPSVSLALQEMLGSCLRYVECRGTGVRQILNLGWPWCCCHLAPILHLDKGSRGAIGKATARFHTLPPSHALRHRTTRMPLI